MNSIATENGKTMVQCVCDKFSMLRHKFYVAIEENYVATQHSESVIKNTQTLSRRRISLLQQRKLEVEVNVVKTKTTIVMTESEENNKKIIATKK